MPCSNTVCGTGLFAGPKPGDPDNNLTISAVGAKGGIQVSWTYPNTNPAAVAHIELYRGTSSVFANAIQRAIVSGNSFFDSIAPEAFQRYYYWIKVISVNGTIGEPVGPAFADPISSHQGILEYLTGLIDEGVLASALRNRIDQLEVISGNLADEILARIADNGIFAEALAQVQSDADTALTYINNETLARISANEALVASINTLAAGFGDASAGVIIEEQTVRASADAALADLITALLAITGSNTSAIQKEQQTRTTTESALAQTTQSLMASSASNQAGLLIEQSARTAADSALVQSAQSLAAKTDMNSAAVVAEQSARTTDSSAISATMAALVAKVDQAAAAVQVEQTARASSESALANQITTTQTTLNGNIASVQTTLQTEIDTTNDVVTNIGARYTAVVDVNGLVGGFGIYNNGTTVEAGFNVDTFWVGRTTNKVKPFIIDAGTVYMDKARIRNADIDTLKISGHAVSVSSFFTQSFGSLAAGQTVNSGAMWVDFAISPQSTIVLATATLVNVGGVASLAEVKIKRSDGAFLGSTRMAVNAYSTTTLALSCIDLSTPNGSYYYYAEILNINTGYGGSFTLDPLSLVGLSTLR